MSWIRTPPEDGATGAVAAAFDRDRATLGYVANYTRVFANRPEVYEAWRGLNGAIKASMDPRRYEVATIAAALRMGSSYCALAHGSVLAEKFDGADAVAALVSNPASSPVDRAVMGLSDKVAAGAAGMTEADLTELRDLGFDDVDILDVVLAAAARCFFSSVLDAVGARPDVAYRSLDPSLRDALTVGRPIAEA